MRGAVNDAGRWLWGLFIGFLARCFGLIEHGRLALFPWTQRYLRRRYGILADTAIHGFGPELEQLIAARAKSLGGRAFFAVTSGSSGAPKRLLYTRGRLLRTKLAFSDAYARACHAHGIRRRSLFLISALADDGSLTARLVVERRIPSAVAALQAPYRMLADPLVGDLVSRHGPAAVRLFLISMANPGVLYATNPSTLSTFFESLHAEWPRARALARAYLTDASTLPGAVRRVARRLWSCGASGRLAAVAASPEPLPIGIWAPGVEAYMTWTGGYVAPFLERLSAHLPAHRYRLIPMYSMSTETIETLPHFGVADAPAFLPVAPGVLYEFLELADDGTPDRPGRLLPPGRLQPGRAYTMVVSDRYGLRRYQTEDMFLCRRLVRGLPDLAFLRRRGLEFSFTGEKLTAQQASGALQRARAKLALPPATHLSLVPSWPEGDPVPHYRLLVVPEGGGPLDLQRLARVCQAELEVENAEYRSKIVSARLGPVRASVLAIQAFAQVVGGERHRNSWEAQLKFLPLYPTRWDTWSPPAATGPAT